MRETNTGSETSFFENALELQAIVRRVLQSKFGTDEERSICYHDRHSIPHYITPRAADHVQIDYNTYLEGQRKKVSLQAQARRNIYITPEGRTYEGVGIYTEQISDARFTPSQGYLFFITEEYDIYDEQGRIAKPNSSLFRKYLRVSMQMANHFDHILAEEALALNPEKAELISQ